MGELRREGGTGGGGGMEAATGATREVCREEGREAEREGNREAGREGGRREGGKEGGRGGKERGRAGGRQQSNSTLKLHTRSFAVSIAIQWHQKVRYFLQQGAARLGAKVRKERPHLSLFEESNEEGPVQRVIVVHAGVGCCRVEVGMPRHFQSCKHRKPNMQML